MSRRIVGYTPEGRAIWSENDPARARLLAGAFSSGGLIIGGALAVPVPDVPTLDAGMTATERERAAARRYYARNREQVLERQRARWAAR